MIYEKVITGVRTQTRSANNRYREVRARAGIRPEWKYASMSKSPDGTIDLYSTADIPPPPARKKSFLKTLRSFPNQMLSDNLEMDGNGGWTSNGSQAGSLVLVHDGSYNKDIDEEKCLTAYIVMCKITRHRL